VCIALILIAESPKQVINLVIHLGNPGSMKPKLLINVFSALMGFLKIQH